MSAGRNATAAVPSSGCLPGGFAGLGPLRSAEPCQQHCRRGSVVGTAQEPDVGRGACRGPKQRYGPGLTSRTLLLMHVHASPTGKTARILQLSLVATFAYVVLTFVFGLRAHSLALLS